MTSPAKKPRNSSQRAHVAQPEPKKKSINVDAPTLAVANTMLRNLESNPMTAWLEVIIAGLESMKHIARAQVAKEEGEDKALDKQPDPNDPEEIGYEFLRRLAQKLGVYALHEDLIPEELKAEWVTKKVKGGGGYSVLEIYYGNKR